MSVQYFAKVVNNKTEEVAVAHSLEQAQALRAQAFAPCSRTFYESVLRETKKNAALSTK